MNRIFILLQLKRQRRRHQRRAPCHGGHTHRLHRGSGSGITSGRFSCSNTSGDFRGGNGRAVISGARLRGTAACTALQASTGAPCAAKPPATAAAASATAAIATRAPAAASTASPLPAAADTTPASPARRGVRARRPETGVPPSTVAVCRVDAPILDPIPAAPWYAPCLQYPTMQAPQVRVGST